MARVSRSLTHIALLVALLGLVSPAPAAGQETSSSWFAAPAVDGKVFPVLRSAQARWLNWRDTYGAPRMRLMEDGVWRQVGVHQGIDIFTEEGAPVVSMVAGTIERVGWTFYSGWRVGVRGRDGKYYFYAHLSSFAPGLSEGREVGAGEFLGEVGNSGYGPVGTADEFPAHLHFGIQAGSRWENPQDLLVSLYREYVSATRAKQSRLVALRAGVRKLRARAYLPGAPAPEVLSTALGRLTYELEQVESSLVTKVTSTRR